MNNANSTPALRAHVVINFPGHPIHGETVELVPSNPDKPFAIVRLLHTCGGYMKSESVRIPRECIVANNN